MNSETFKALPAPKGPFPVVELRPDSARTQKVVGWVNSVPIGALALVNIGALHLSQQKPGQPAGATRKVRYLDPLTIALYYSDGALRAVVAIEAVPAPQGAAHPGDILVDRQGVK